MKYMLYQTKFIPSDDMSKDFRSILEEIKERTKEFKRPSNIEAKPFIRQPNLSNPQEKIEYIKKHMQASQIYLDDFQKDWDHCSNNPLTINWGGMYYLVPRLMKKLFGKVLKDQQTFARNIYKAFKVNLNSNQTLSKE
jgi:hypothetical protein